MRIARVANFVSPTSGGIRTVLHHWGECYLAQGHDAALIIPGPGAWRTEEDQGTVFRVPAWPWPDKGGYSLILRRKDVLRALDEYRPDRVEVSDRTTLRWVGAWAQSRGVGSVMISHEFVTGVLQRRARLPRPLAERGADVLNRLSARSYDAIACPSSFAAAEFERIGVHAHVVPLGVDLDDFRILPADDTLVPDGTAQKTPGRTYLVHCGRLHLEKNPALSLETLRALVTSGMDAHLTVLGDGPMKDELVEQGRGLPVTYMEYQKDRAIVARVLGRADVVVAPGAVETFGLAALEALACGTPVVCPDEGALGEVVGSAGVSTSSNPEAFAAAVRELLARPQARREAREQAERFSWSESAARMLALHASLSA